MATGWHRTGFIKNGSSFKYVQKYLTESKEERYYAKVGRKCKSFANERDAAKFVDLKLIEQGKEPVNILVRK